MRRKVNRTELPEKFPTNRHSSEFWESLGRTVATFGFLEEILGKAIFSFTATKPYGEKEIQQAYEKWQPQLENALKDQLWVLIESYGKAVREHPNATIENLDELLCQLKEASKIRNVICHGSWGPPNISGASMPLFVNRQMEKFETPIDINFLDQVQRHSTELICEVIDTVTQMGWQFPSSKITGKVIWEKKNCAI